MVTCCQNLTAVKSDIFNSVAQLTQYVVLENSNAVQAICYKDIIFLIHWILQYQLPQIFETSALLKVYGWQ